MLAECRPCAASTGRFFLWPLGLLLPRKLFFALQFWGFYSWRHYQHRLPLALATSSVLFGLAHLANVAEQAWSVTVFQVVAAGGLGLFFAVVYVYTGQLWLTMVMHGLFDLLSFMATGTTTMKGSQVTLADWSFVAGELVIFILVTALMMFGQRRRVMERHVARLTGDKQRFGFQIRY